jgi:guanylate kinase
MTPTQKRLIIISAPSGTGKTTLCARLLKAVPRLRLSISSTTRPPRGQEQHGTEYFFLTQEQFRAGIEAGEFAEWAEVFGNYYGTSKKMIEGFLALGYAVLLDIDVQGAESLRAAYPGQVLSIFISPPDMATLEKRLRSRGTDSEEQIQKRLRTAAREMAEAPRFDLTIINDDLERAYTELYLAVTRALGEGA